MIFELMKGLRFWSMAGAPWPELPTEVYRRPVGQVMYRDFPPDWQKLAGVVAGLWPGGGQWQGFGRLLARVPAPMGAAGRLGAWSQGSQESRRRLPCVDGGPEGATAGNRVPRGGGRPPLGSLTDPLRPGARTRGMRGPAAGASNELIGSALPWPPPLHAPPFEQCTNRTSGASRSRASVRRPRGGGCPPTPAPAAWHCRRDCRR